MSFGKKLMKKLMKKFIEKLIEKLMKIGISEKITKIKNKAESFIKEAMSIIPTGNVGIGVSTPKKRGRPKGSKNKVKT